MCVTITLTIVSKAILINRVFSDNRTDINPVDCLARPPALSDAGRGAPRNIFEQMND